MEGKDNSELWDWQDDAFRLDIEPPLTISQSLWDDFSQNETDVAALFGSTPASEITSTKASDIMCGKEGNAVCSSEHSWHEDNPRLKRRRILKFGAGEADFNSCDLHLDNVSQKLMSYNDSFIGSRENFQMHHPSSTRSMWFTGNDESPHALGAMEQAAESWMRRCFNNDREEESAEDQLKKGDSLAALPENLIFGRQESSQGLLSTVIGKKAVRKVMPKLATPVAYPFAVVKPSGVQGDVTLHDINQRILMPPSRLLPHATSDAGTASVVTESDSFPSSSLTSTTAPSGKSVVALTKIHTEGKGTITIMRTRN